jgi:glycosyltransferase involved in cell wall biosynthesis
LGACARLVTFPLYPEVRLAYPTAGVWCQLDRFEPEVVHLAGPVTIEELRARGFERLELWSRGVDTDLFTPDRRDSAWRTRLGAGPDDLLVLSVGRLAREKKLDRLAGALCQVSGVHLAIVGTGPDRERLESVFAGLPVNFTGVLHGADLAAGYAAGDVFAFPSDTETFGNVVLEAMASGLPVVATTVGGQTDLISHATTGLLAAPEDVDRFAAHITAYRDDALLRSRHGAAGLAIARARTWQHQVELLIQHYLAAMNRVPPVVQSAETRSAVHSR